MKLKKLLVLSALWLTATGAMAAIAEVREKPAIPKTQGFVASESTDQYYYLYNVDAQAFFTEGNAWGTQVSLGPTGLKAAFVPEGTAYLFNDFSVAKNAWKNVFFDNENQMFVDLGSQANYRWGVEDNGETFRLFAADEEAGNPGFGEGKPAYREGMYVGWVKGSSSTACVPYLPVADENCINWAFVTEEDYLPYAEAILVYNAAEALKTVLEEAEGLGANIAAQLEVFNNLSSTVEELNAAGEALKPIIEARKNLKKALDEAKAAGFTETADADAVYGNGDATKAQLEKALTDLNAAVVEWGKTHASVANPANMTSKIVNPNFDNASYTGWTSDGDNPNMTGSGSHGPANVAEHWNHVFNTYQDIADLPAGVYALGAQVGWRSSWQEMLDGVGPAASLYATVGDVEFSTPFANMWACRNTESLAGATEFGTSAGENKQDVETEDGVVTYYSPNDPSAFRLYAEKGYYDRKLLFGVSEGTVRIGVKMPTKLGGGDNWSCFDTFTLTYYGSGADAAQLYVDESLKNFSEVTIPEGTIYTESYLTAYQEALAGDKTANNFEEAVAIISAIGDTKKALDKNIQLWKDWQDLVNDVRAKYVLTDEYAGIEPEIDDIADYVDESMNVTDILDAHELTNEQLQAEMDQLNEWVESLIEKSKLDVYDNKNMTSYIKNPTFETSTTKNTGTSEGWTIDRINGGNVTPGPIGGDGDTFLEKCGYYNGCFESWHCHKWDVWQEIKGLPVGMYELEVQGYVRCEVSGYQKGNPLEPDYPSPVYLYMNNATSQFPSVYSEIPAENGVEFQTVEGWTTESINDQLFPNSMGGAAQCFHIDKEAGLSGMYKTTAYGLIAKEGDTFRIGVKMDADQDWWCIWDNFKLTYKKPTVDIVKPELEKALQSIDTTQPMGKSLVAQAQEAQTKGQAAMASNDAQEMFDALADIYALQGSIRASVELFKGLQTAAADLDNAAFLSENATAKAEAQALAAEINDGISNNSYEDAEVEGLKEQIAKATTKLNMPEDMASASDADPKECTKVIKTPAFENEEDYTNSSAGWTGAGNLGNDDTQKSVLAMEFWQSAFDMYQTIIGLPKGTYKLTVDAWCRAGSNDENFTGWQGNPEHTMAFLYAVDGDSTVYSAPVANVMKGLVSENPGIEGVDEVILGEVTYYMPNSLVGGRSYMDIVEEGTYTNSVICKVGDDGKLTVGIKKPEQKNNSWVVLDNFRLFYLGANSSAEVSGDAATAISTLDAETPVKVEFFSLSGARINKPGKGVAIMKQTLSDGSVKLQKVIVK